MVTRFTTYMMHSAARRGSIPPGQRLEDVLDLKAHVVAVTDRAELAGGCGLDPGVVSDESEGIPHIRRARLEHEGALPVVEHAVRRDDPAAVVRGGDEEGVQEAVVVEVEEAGLEAAGAPRVLRAAAVADDRDRVVDAGQAEGDGEHEVARRVEDVLVEELRRDEDRLRRVQPADEAVQVEPGGEVEGVALEHLALHRPLAREVEEAGIEEGIEAALGVVLLLEATGCRRAGRAGRIGARPPPLAVHGLALEIGRLGAHDAVPGWDREGERGAADRHAREALDRLDLVAEAGEVGGRRLAGQLDLAGQAEADAGHVEVGVIVRERVGDVLAAEHETRAAAHLAAVGDVGDRAQVGKREAEAARLPRRALRDAGYGRDPVAEGREALEEGVVQRPHGAEVVARARHVEREPPLVERDEEAAEGVVERVDVVEQTEHVGLAPGEDLAADAEEDRPLLEVDVAEEEAVALARDAAQEVDAPLDVRVGEPVAEQARDVREVEAHRLELAELVVEFVGSVVVDPLALAAVLQAVLERVRVDPVEQPGEAPARLGEPAHVVVELQLEEIAVLAEMARGGVRESERVVVAAHLLGADTGRGVGAEAEAHLAAVVERQGARRTGEGAEDHAGQDEPGEEPPRTSRGRRRHRDASPLRSPTHAGGGVIGRRFARCQGTRRRASFVPAGQRRRYSARAARPSGQNGSRPARAATASKARNSPRTISSGWRRKGPSWRARYTMPWTTVCSSAQRSGKSGSGSSATPSSSRASRRAPSSNDSPAASTPPMATSQWPG